MKPDGEDFNLLRYEKLSKVQLYLDMCGSRRQGQCRADAESIKGHKLREERLGGASAGPIEPVDPTR